MIRVNLACAKHNIDFIKRRVGAEIYAVVKADAYGHGAEFCRHIESEVFGFAVSCAYEAEELRRLKIKKPILILCPTKEEVDCEDIIYTVCDKGDLSLRRGNKVAIKINTGMNRLGVAAENFSELLDGVRKRGLILSEIFTHFTSIENAERQFTVFNKIVAPLNIPNHCCASNCLTLPKKMHGSAVRCGLALYGYGYDGLLPILNAYTYVGQINKVKRGMNVGYGDFVALRDMKIAVLKAGYADGIRRLEGRRVRINGYTCPIVGKICMDMCMADVTDAYVEKGDRAFFLDNILNAEVLASEQNTIAYEILTMFSAKRIQRIYE